MAQKALNRALALLGPLEARIMRVIWSGQVAERFTVRDIQREMSELAYTTIMTTVVRLAAKGLLHARAISQQKAHEYRVALTPEEFVTRASRQDVAQLVRRYGDAALIAFAARIDELDPEQRKRLRELGRQ
jgi:predicted transcriptional regulator